ncbi:MAG: SUMF1/EgtB/PvdO family nonheme iron enzyme [Candidatus Coatesbacteria bacterium]|nr:SUMF1/EgtB/PvdO family nonheme iron enzyme [Candidatus Coatesbacteria bacterium]
MKSAALIVAVAILILLAVTAIADPSITIYTDESSYQSGDTIEVSLSARNYADGISVDAYVGLLTPDGWIYALGPSGWGGLLTAWMPNVYVPNGFLFAPTSLWWFDIPCSMPPIAGEGDYNFAAVLTYPSTFGWASDLSLAPFSIEGPGSSPTAHIDSIYPDPATQGEDTVQFRGHGEDSDGWIQGYEWSSSYDGILSTDEDFSMEASSLTVGTHTISYKVRDNDGLWSAEATQELTVIGENIAPTAYIDSISPNPATQGEHTIQFTGHGTDDDGTVDDFQWRSSIDGVLSTDEDFSKQAGDLTVGTHTIYFKVWDNDGDASSEVSHQLTVQPGQTTGTVKGYVYETGTSTPISGVQVSIGSISDTTGSSGFYELTSVPVGQRTIEASASGYQAYSASITVSEGSNSRDIYLTASVETTNLQGTVMEWDNSPIQGARVEVAGMFEYTDATGHYQFPNVPQGNQTLSVTEVDCYEEFSAEVYLYTAEKTYNVRLDLQDLAVPGNLEGTPEYALRNVLIWDEVECATGYNVYLSTDGGSHDELLNSSAVSDTEYEHTFDTYYMCWYAVCAVRADGDEGPRTEWIEVDPIQRITMVSIPAGSFLMGSPSSESGRESDEGPQRTVNISEIEMSQTEVTQKQWEDIMGWNDSYFSGDDRPVEEVTWYDCVYFCNQLSQADGLTNCYTITNIDWSGNHIDDAYVTCNFEADGYRLPTEAEWEYACRAGTTTRFNTGDADSDLSAAGWYSSNSSSRTHDVGEKHPNAWGLFDMHGNVWEWCWDWYSSGYYGSQPNPDSDPTGPSSGSLRVVRGGSWDLYARHCRSAYRRRDSPWLRSSYFGFRLCRSQ